MAAASYFAQCTLLPDTCESGMLSYVYQL